jgi:hypothetical protein
LSRDLTVKTTAIIRIKKVVIDFDTSAMQVSGLVWPDLKVYKLGNNIFSTEFGMSFPLRDEAEDVLSEIYKLIGEPEGED